MAHSLESGIYGGKVRHERRVPTQHAFDYTMFFFWLKLDELNLISDTVSGFRINKLAPYQFKTGDYLNKTTQGTIGDLDNAIRQKMQTLGSPELNGDLFFMGQIRALGLFFSPVNFYFHRPNGSDTFDWMLAEVSNTPWNQRHYYLVDLDKQEDSEKAFHVSPFNPIDMVYKWQIAQPSNKFDMALSCYKGERHFTASLDLEKQPLTSKAMRRLIVRMPSTTLFSVIGIYWQALKLFIKRTPFYAHPDSTNNSVQENNNVSK